MQIGEMTAKDCRDFLARMTFGRLGCASDNQPYVLPIYFVYEPDHLYGFATFGQKIEWMRANPKVCVEADEIASHFQWVSVVVNGRYRELPDTAIYADERANALALLEKRFLWWQTAFAARRFKTGGDFILPLFYSIDIDSITGYRAAADAGETSFFSPASS